MVGIFLQGKISFYYHVKYHDWQGISEVPQTVYYYISTQCIAKLPGEKIKDEHIKDCDWKAINHSIKPKENKAINIMLK